MAQDTVRRSFTATRVVSHPISTGSAPRNSRTAQTVAAKKSDSVTTLASLNRHGQLPMASAPVPFSNRTATRQVSSTTALRSAKTHTHPSTTIPNAPVFASTPTTPIVLRGFMSQRGTSKQQVVIPPPQATVPNYAKRIVRS